MFLLALVLLCLLAAPGKSAASAHNNNITIRGFDDEIPALQSEYTPISSDSTGVQLDHIKQNLTIFMKNIEQSFIDINRQLHQLIVEIQRGERKLEEQLYGEINMKLVVSGEIENSFAEREEILYSIQQNLTTFINNFEKRVSEVNSLLDKIVWTTDKDEGQQEEPDKAINKRLQDDWEIEMNCISCRMMLQKWVRKYWRTKEFEKLVMLPVIAFTSFKAVQGDLFAWIFALYLIVPEFF